MLLLLLTCVPCFWSGPAWCQVGYQATGFAGAFNLPVCCSSHSLMLCCSIPRACCFAQMLNYDVQFVPCFILLDKKGEAQMHSSRVSVCNPQHWLAQCGICFCTTLCATVAVCLLLLLLCCCCRPCSSKERQAPQQRSRHSSPQRAAQLGTTATSPSPAGPTTPGAAAVIYTHTLTHGPTSLHCTAPPDRQL